MDSRVSLCAFAWLGSLSSIVIPSAPSQVYFDSWKNCLENRARIEPMKL